jgi:hypothetical protein
MKLMGEIAVYSENKIENKKFAPWAVYKVFKCYSRWYAQRPLRFKEFVPITTERHKADFSVEISHPYCPGSLFP